jgi:hypothetical protein
MKISPILKILIVLVFCCTSVVWADNRKDGSRTGHPPNSQYTHGRPDNRQSSDSHPDQGHMGSSDYRHEHGYREHPYDRGRHYGHYDYRGHQYEYRGHWSSWAEWNRYAKRHPEISRQGSYYRENAHLMFRFCEPGTGNCLFFSIGR